MKTFLIFMLTLQTLYATISAKSLQPQAQACSLKKEVGPCRAKQPMFYYDVGQGKCLSFIYGGCRGNANRFKTLADCEKRCNAQGQGKNCERPCFLIYRPVCGSDGITYPNECVLKAADCKSEDGVIKVHDGPCRDKCERPCPRIYNPVCGSDGKTYPNECVLNVADCKSEDGVKKVHDGPCKPKAKCPEVCTMEYNPQCGSDGVTYSNPCALKIATCKSNGRIILTHEGRCDVCSLKKVVGPCRAAFPRFYYNSGSGKCENFTYGGCRGNDNNFATLQECQENTKSCGH